MAASLTPGRRWRRRAGAGAVLLAVTLGHGWLAQRLLQDRLGWGEGERVVRLDVAFVRELQPALPPAPPRSAPPPAARRPRQAPPAAPAASAPSPADAASAAGDTAERAEAAQVAASAASQASAAELAQAAASSPTPTPPPSSGPTPSDGADEATSTAPVIASAASAASAAPPTAALAAQSAYDWLPPSTQLSYTLVGDVNGPVHGSAQVRWIRQGDRYQVQIDTRVALVATRRLTSDGRLGPQGLVPRRYDEETEFLLASPRRRSVRFEDGQVVLDNGRALPSLPGVQDTASQLVQLVWLFTMQPRRLAPGATVDLPLALPRRLDLWSYEVGPQETVHTDFGAIDTFPVRPRRPAQAVDVLTVQPWIAPSLQYLPVKLRIEQNERVWVELLLQRPPLQAAPAPSSAPAR